MHSIEAIPSPANGREFVCSLWVPDTHPIGTCGLAVLLHGRGSGSSPSTAEDALRQSRDGDRLQALAELHRLVVVKPMLGSYAHLDSPIDPAIRRATFLGSELVPWLAGHTGLVHERRRCYIAGFSMGGTGAINVLARYPEVYAVGINFGGNTDPAFQAIARGVAPPATDVLGPYPERRDDYRLWSNEHAIELLSRRRDVALGFGCGVEDERLEWVRRSHRTAVLHKLITAHHEFPGGHHYDWRDIAAQLAMADRLAAAITAA